jgi:hypothetical protein
MKPDAMALRRSPGTAPATTMRFAAALLVGSALLAPVASARGDEVVRAASGISYMSGGAGTESVDRLRSMEKDFSLKLVFALDSGAYLADVHVIITDASDTVVLDAVAEGPWLLATLPTGRYRVDASFGGRAETRRVVIGPGTLRTIEFRWPTG